MVVVVDGIVVSVVVIVVVVDGVVVIVVNGDEIVALPGKDVEDDGEKTSRHASICLKQKDYNDKSKLSETE